MFHTRWLLAGLAGLAAAGPAAADVLDLGRVNTSSAVGRSARGAGQSRVPASAFGEGIKTRFDLTNLFGRPPTFSSNGRGSSRFPAPSSFPSTRYPNSFSPRAPTKPSS